MEITILGTGSTGNAYIVGNADTRLLLDCGLPWRQMQKRSGFTLSSIDACLITHEHGDHCKGAADVAKNGIPLIASRGTFDNLPAKIQAAIPAHRRQEIAEGAAPTCIGSFRVMALHVEHDAAQPFAYLIQDPAAKELLLYATDTPYLEYNVRGLTHLMVEANYDYANTDMADSRLVQRVLKTHLSIDALEEWLRTSGSRNTLRQIWLLHLSDERSNEAEFKRRIQAITGAEVYVAA